MLYVIINGRKRRVYEKNGRFYIFVRNQKNIDKKDVFEQTTPARKVAIKPDLNRVLQYNRELSETIARLQNQIEEKERQLVQKDTDAESLRRTYESEIARISSQIGLGEEELRRQLEAKEREYNAAIAQLQQTGQRKLEEDIAQLRQNYEKEIQELLAQRGLGEDELRRQLEAKEREFSAEIARLQQNSQRDLEAKDADIARLQQKYANEIQEILAQRGLGEDELRRQLEAKERDFRAEIDRLQGECRERIESLEQSRQVEIEQANNELRAQLDREYSERVAVQYARIIELENAIEESITHLTNTERRINELENNQNEIMARYRQLGEERDNLLREKTRLEEELNNAQVSTVENLGQYNDCDERIDVLNNEIRELRRQIRDMPTEIEELRDLLDRTTRERDQLQQQLGEAVSRSVQGENVSGIEELEQEFVRARTDLENRLRKCNDLLSACEVDVDAKTAEVERLTRENSEMVKNYNRLVEEAAVEIEEEIKEEMEDDRKALRKDLSDCNSRFDELKAAHSEIEDEHANTFKEVLELRKKVEKLSDENEIFREVIEEMLGLLNEEDREKLVRKLTA